MTIAKQISVFIENKSGQMAELIKVLGNAQVDLMALSVAESQDYGILRLIVDDAEKAGAALRDAGWVYTTTEVLSVLVPDEPGSLEKILVTLANANISVAYCYAFVTRQQGHACLTLRVDDNTAAAKVLEDAGVIL